VTTGKKFIVGDLPEVVEEEIPEVQYHVLDNEKQDD